MLISTPLEFEGFNTEFRQFLNIARRSLFEDASMLLVFRRMSLVTEEELATLLVACDALSRKITNFSRTLEAK